VRNPAYQGGTLALLGLALLLKADWIVVSMSWFRDSVEPGFAGKLSWSLTTQT